MNYLFIKNGIVKNFLEVSDPESFFLASEEQLINNVGGYRIGDVYPKTMTPPPPTETEILNALLGVVGNG